MSLTFSSSLWEEDVDDGEDSRGASASGSTASKSTFSTRQYDPSQIPVDSSQLVRLAIFPLRKSVKFPTECLTLNLYEDRYLALAEDVLHLRDSENPHTVDDEASEGSNGANPVQSTSIRGVFGALDAGSCSHIVVPAATMGSRAASLAPVYQPITPLVERGDVGVLFGVDTYVDGRIPTIGSGLRRRIRMEAQGLVRFQVERVVESGFRSPVSRRTTTSGSDVPYVVVDARIVRDETPRQSSELERRIRLASMKLFGMTPDEYLSSIGLGPLARSNATSTDTEARWETTTTSWQSELLSFAVASRAMELQGTTVDAAARRELLLLDDSSERLRRVSY